MGVESVSVVAALSHTDTLEIYNFPTIALLPALESIERKDIQAIESLQQTFTYNIAGVQHLNYWDRLHELKLYSLQRCRERYIFMDLYLEDNTAYGAKYCWYNVTQNRTLKTSKTWNSVRYSVSNKQKPSTIPPRKCNNCIWASAVQLVVKISERHRKC